MMLHHDGAGRRDPYRGKGHLYRLTTAGEDFRPIVELLSIWRQRWGQGLIGPDDLDPGMLVLDDVIPKNHLLRRMNVFVTTALADLHQQLQPFYSEIGRPSIDPELMMQSIWQPWRRKPNRKTRRNAAMAQMADESLGLNRKPPKVISPSDPSSAWTAKANKRVPFGYGNVRDGRRPKTFTGPDSCIAANLPQCPVQTHCRAGTLMREMLARRGVCCRQQRSAARRSFRGGSHVRTLQA
jgi:hypothetical protein